MVKNSENINLKNKSLTFNNLIHFVVKYDTNC
jgi:hypothetical protein